MTFSCSEAMREVSAEYASLPLKTRSGKNVQLRNILMLSDEGIAEARELLAGFGGDSEDTRGMLELMRNLLTLVADKPDAMREEFTEWPFAMYVKCVDAWREATEMGEAQHSGS